MTLDAGDDDFVVPARTLGRHPYLFVYDPRPLRRLLRSGVFDIIDVHEEPGSLAVAELSVLRRVYCPTAKVVLYTAQNLDKRLPIPFRWFHRAALRRADEVYCVSTGAQDVLRRLGFTGGLEVLGLGVDVERFSAQSDPTAPHLPLRVGYVGRLEDHKGVQTLLEALRHVDRVSLRVVGEGPSRPALVARASALGLSDRVTFQGFVTHEDLPAVYRGLDAVVVPSMPTPGWVEQFCRVAVEAMASGVPVVASRSGSLPEVVGTGGILVPPGDPVSLANAIRTLDAAGPVERAALCKLAREQAQRYSWAAIAEAHYNMYLRVAG